MGTWEPHERACREISTHTCCQDGGRGLFSQREGFRQKGKGEMLEARSVRTDSLNLNKLGAEVANGGHKVKHTGIISLQ